jgi:hypothetical protein
MPKNKLKEITEKGIQQKQLTDQLIKLVEAALYPVMDAAKENQATMKIDIGDVRLRTDFYESNIGECCFVEIFEKDDDHPYWFRTRGVLWTKKAQGELEVITNGPGESWYVHGDFGCPIRSAYRKWWLWAAEHMPEILEGFGAQMDEVNASLSAAVKRLVDMAR